MQTCDTKLYPPFLEVTGRTLRAYAGKYNLDYACYMGIKRGSKPWHAALNRIILIADMLRNGYKGWIVYADADAYVADLTFDLCEYLKYKSEYGFIGSPSGIQPPIWWEINNGVFALNLGHWSGQKIASRWEEKLLIIPEDILNSEEKWGDVADDQELLHAVFREFDELQPFVFIDDVEPKIFNWDARFIKQVIRENGGHSVRINKISKAVAEIFNEPPPQELFDKERFYEDLVIALYEILLYRRPDGGGLRYAIASLSMGSHTIRDQIASMICSEEFEARFSDILSGWRSLKKSES